MKTVFTNSMVCHVWAQQNQEQGRNQSGSYSFSGKELVSYGTTIALHYGDFVLKSADTFSVTTSQHMPGSWATGKTTIAVDGIFSWGRRFYGRREMPKGAEIKKAILASILGLSTSYAKRKRDTTRQHDANQIGQRLADLLFICNRFKLAYPKGYDNVQAALGMTNKEVERLAKAEKRERAKERKRIKVQLQEDEEQFQDWLNAEVCMDRDDASILYVACPNSFRRMDQAFLTVRQQRLQPAIVHTSQGATAPLDHVKKAFKLYRRVVKSDKSWESNGEQARLGHFKLDRIEANGDAKAGCHLFKAEELERFAALWKL